MKKSSRKKSPAGRDASRGRRKKKTDKENRARAAANEDHAINKGVKDEITAILLTAAGVFMVIAFQTEAAGAVGTGLSHFFKGLFGFTAYILPYYFVVYGIFLFLRKTAHAGLRSTVLLAVIFLSMSLINSGRFLDDSVIDRRIMNISVYYNNGMALDDGGVFGMVTGKCIAELIGMPGLYISASVTIIICVLMLMNTPVSRIFEKAGAKKAERGGRNGKEKKGAGEHLHDAGKRIRDAVYGEEEAMSAEHRRKIRARHKKILDYVKDEDMDTAPLKYTEGTGADAMEAPAEKKRGKKNEPVISVSMPEEEKQTGDLFGEPIAAGGFSVRQTEEKLSRKEAENLMLSQEDFNTARGSAETYRFPPVSLMKQAEQKGVDRNAENSILRSKADKLEETLRSFNIDAQVTNVTQGPAVTRYEVHPNSGVKVKGIKNLSDDIALNMEAKSIRIEAPIPGKPAVGIEIENEHIRMVTIREIIDSMAFKKSKSRITFAVGKDIAGKAIVADLKSMPHLLIAGSTGSGKSVCINSIIASILYKARPDEVKFVLVDPKVVELANYNGIPHLLIPVVTDPSKAAAALNWAVAEMDDRYRKFAAQGVRDLASFNKAVRAEDQEDSVMPQVVIIIDELADLMMAAPSQVEESICRLAQKARAAGMHLIVATQRPSVDVITGVIKANIPSRIAFAVSSQFDSRTILDMSGAEKLVGKGDMLFNPLGTGKPVRVQGAFISDEEVNSIIEFVKGQSEENEYSSNVIESIERANRPDAEKNERDLEDELLTDAIELVVQMKQASVSMLQRRFRIGYNRAARMIDMMEDRQIVGPQDGSRPRQVLISEEQLEEMKNQTKELEKE